MADPNIAQGKAGTLGDSFVAPKVSDREAEFADLVSKAKEAEALRIAEEEKAEKLEREHGGFRVGPERDQWRQEKIDSEFREVLEKLDMPFAIGTMTDIEKLSFIATHKLQEMNAGRQLSPKAEDAFKNPDLINQLNDTEFVRFKKLHK